MKKTLFLTFLAFLLFFGQSFAQNNEIKGLLVDSLSGSPLEFASISIKLKSQPEIIAGQLSNEKGLFSINKLKKETYIIKIEYISYSPKIIEATIEGNDRKLDLGAISLSPISQLLEAITISGVKPNVLVELERQVYKADQFEVAKGGTATDVLRNMPSVSVNAEGNISVRGSSGFLILVNGKPIQADAATVLSQLPANSIDKVELITSPSAKYDADGKAGIINIITKRGATDGLSISTNIQYGLPRIKEYANAEEPHRYGIDGVINYKKDKWDLSFSGNYLKNDIAGQRVGDVNTTINNIFTSFPSQGERSYKRYSYGVRAIANYSLNAKNEFSAGFYSGRKSQYRLADIFYNNTKRNLTTNALVGQIDFFNSNLVLKTGDFTVGNLDFTHKFSNNSSLSFSGLYEKAELDGFTKNRNLNNKNFADTLQYTLNTGNSPLNAYRFKVDYEKPTKNGKLAFGYQFRNQTQKGTFLYQERIKGTSKFYTFPDFSADIKILNTIHALYGQYSGKLNKLEYNTGLRYENSYRSFTDNKNSIPAVLKLSNFFPSANFLYSLPKSWKAKAAYSRRVQRSTNNELNPYPEREHSETLEQGDPNIRPEFIGLYEAGIIKDFPKGSAFLTFYMQNIKDIVNRVNSVYNDTILNRIYTNAGKAKLLGIETGINLKPVKWWQVYVGANVYQLTIKGALFNDKVAVNSNGSVFSINTNSTFQLSKTLTTQFNLNYLSKRNTAQGEDSRFFLPNLSVKKTFLANKFAASFQWQNIALGKMKTNQQRITTFGSNFYTTTNYIQETNILMLNLSYNFNQTSKKSKLPNSEFGEKEF